MKIFLNAKFTRSKILLQLQKYVLNKNRYLYFLHLKKMHLKKYFSTASDDERLAFSNEMFVPSIITDET